MAPPLAVSMGEPAGIGGEITLKAWLARQRENLPPFFAIDDLARLQAIAAALPERPPVIPLSRVSDAAAAFSEGLPVLPIRLAQPAVAGRVDPANAQAVLRSLQWAVELCRQGEAGGLVTNPIQKKVLYDAGFHHPGHTEYLAELCGGQMPVMLFDSRALRVVPVTIHLALKEAAAALTTRLILDTARIAEQSLREDFGIAAPRLAVAGLNPHAGEGGSLGREDIEIVAPAVAQLRQSGIDARGPLPPDTMFHAEARQTYDLALCMYHDQALIPLKTLDFHGAVNVTVGLPIVRTSPDHGTALDIAGQNRASAESLIAAIRCAGGIATRRADFRARQGGRLRA